MCVCVCALTSSRLPCVRPQGLLRGDSVLHPGPGNAAPLEFLHDGLAGKNRTGGGAG